MDSVVYIQQDEDLSSRLYFLLKKIRERLASRNIRAVIPNSVSKRLSDQISVIQRTLLEISQILPQNPVDVEVAEYADDIDTCMGCSFVVAETLEDSIIRAAMHSPAATTSTAENDTQWKRYMASLKDLTSVFQYILTVAKQKSIAKSREIMSKPENRQKLEILTDAASQMTKKRHHLHRRASESQGVLHAEEREKPRLNGYSSSSNSMSAGSSSRKKERMSDELANVVGEMKRINDTTGRGSGGPASGPQMQELLDLGDYLKDMHIDPAHISPQYATVRGEAIGWTPRQMDMFNEDVFDTHSSQRRRRSSTLNDVGPEGPAAALRGNKKWLGKIFR